ncbi:MAG: hypothetical protein KC420_12960 [Myxococcales bacterium]|nr:hypothetical protein [Myxococcales bacterium]
MYGFRKPFTAGAWPGSISLWEGRELDLKVALLIAQVVGYCISKFLGIKVISEMSGRRRGLAILALIAVAELALVAFALTPAPYSIAWLLVNGLPLGMVWGLVFGYLEGRRLSEVLGAGLSASYILASGFVKTVGRWILALGVPEAWMPALTGLIFLPPLLVAVWMLGQLPAPSAEDELLRTRRAPMDGATRGRFFRGFAPGLLLLTGLYVLLTAFRDFRDNFAPEIWDALGYADTPSVMTTAEIPITVGVLLALASIMKVRDNRRALLLIHGIMAGGALLIVAATAAWQLGVIGAAPWMILVGLGLYVGYVPFGCVLFDRLIAAVGFVGTAGFMIYVTDAFGYLGSVGLLLYKSLGQASLSWLDFFVGAAYATGLVALACFGGSLAYFARRTRALARAPHLE